MDDIGNATAHQPVPGDPDWVAPANAREMWQRSRDWIRTYHARWSDVRWWLVISIAIAVVMLIGTAIAASLSNDVDATAGQYNILTESTDRGGDFLYLIVRNHLVLGIHFGACLIGAIIGRRRGHRKPNASHGFNPDLPRWVSYAALWYAWIVTCSSIIVQTTKIGAGVADVAAYLHISPIAMVLMLLPHALLELAAIFLPLALFMKEARAGRLEDMGLWSIQAALIAVPMIITAAAIEVFISPHIIQLFV